MEHKGDKGCDYKSHPPTLDHSKSLNDFKSMGIPIYAPYLKIDYMSMNMGGFTVEPFDLTTIDGSWTHTNANGEPCSIYGFLITHPEMGRMLYITDCEVVKWKFKDINHILLGVNYDKDLVDTDNQLPGEDAENPQEITQKDDMQARIKALLTHLPEREQLVLSLYYLEEFTFKQIGEILSLTEARICQLHSQAIAKIQTQVDRDLN